jgi:enoyl-CoA hydratase
MSANAQPVSLADGKLLVFRDGPVATLVINRPDVRNALDNDTARALAEALRGFDADAEARVAVLTGAGGAFCAGADLKQLGAGVDYFPWAGSAEGPLRAALAKPVIAAVEGHACAGGLGVALFCDIRIVDDTAIFGVFSRRWGVPMSDGTTVRLPRIVGQGRALDMLITGRAVGADEAVAIGLATRKVAPGTTRAEAEALAHRIAGFPQIALRSDRRSAYDSFDRDTEAAILHEMQLSLAARQVEAQAGAARFSQGSGRGGSFVDIGPRPAAAISAPGSPGPDGGGNDPGRTV